MNESEFEKNTITKEKNGCWEVSCNKGLWSVSAPNKHQATQEAIGYFLQYWDAGEYIPDMAVMKMRFKENKK